MGILDTIIDTKHTDLIQHFEPDVIVVKTLSGLKERDKLIVSKRFGLSGEESQTLETIGKQLDLTRERVRQIEKTLMKHLQASMKEHESFVPAAELLRSTIHEHGGVMAEENLFSLLNIQGKDQQAVRFMLHLVEGLTAIKNDDELKEAWATIGFDAGKLREFLATAKNILEQAAKPMSAEKFLEHYKNTDHYKEHGVNQHDKVVLNYLGATREIKRNPFGDYGIHHWNEISPRDVGDKAYIVMKHHKKPEHYTVITELINKHGLDNRTAFKETVHNELIKDKRFILVGRGIYALAEWGYTSGVVADVIVEILKETKEPMTRNQIVEEVLKRRMVKKNTILVGLSNKKLFKKVAKNLYALA